MQMPSPNSLNCLTRLTLQTTVLSQASSEGSAISYSRGILTNESEDRKTNEACVLLGAGTGHLRLQGPINGTIPHPQAFAAGNGNA